MADFKTHGFEEGDHGFGTGEVRVWDVDSAGVETYARDEHAVELVFDHCIGAREEEAELLTGGGGEHGWWCY